MMILATRGKLNSELEGSLLPDKPVSKFKEKLDRMRIFSGLWRSRAEAELSKEPIDPAVGDIYNYIETALELNKLGTLLCHPKADKDQRFQGEVAKEMARILIERLTGIAIEVEAELTTGLRTFSDLGVRLVALEEIRRGKGMHRLLPKLDEEAYAAEAAGEELATEGDNDSALDKKFRQAGIAEKTGGES
jgi:hypothetical protein